MPCYDTPDTTQQLQTSNYLDSIATAGLGHGEFPHLMV